MSVPLPLAARAVACRPCLRASPSGHARRQRPQGRKSRRRIEAAPGARSQSPAVAPHATQPQQIVVKYTDSAPDDASAHAARTDGSGRSRRRKPVQHTPAVAYPRAPASTRRSRSCAREKDVVWAVPDYVAHATSVSIPNDPGTAGHTAGGWQQAQWNFDGTYGIDASQAWANVDAGRGAGRGESDRGRARHRRGLCQPRQIPPLAGLQQVLVRAGL